MFVRAVPSGLAIVSLLVQLPLLALADPDPAHEQVCLETPQPWLRGLIPYGISKLAPAQQTNALNAMQRGMDTGANINENIKPGCADDYD